MRTLNFKVNKQIITKEGDFENLVAGTCGYLHANFQFSPDWNGMKKVVTFKAGGKEYYAPVIGDTCCIPTEGLQYSKIEVYVEGRKPGGRIVTNGVEFEQVGGKE